jgi:hypothetical protein
LIDYNELKIQYLKFIRCVPWNLFISTRFAETNVSTVDCVKHIKLFNRDIGINIKKQISSFSVINHYPFTHIHSLIYCKTNELSNNDLEHIRKGWKYDIDVQTIYKNEGATFYTIQKNMIKNYSETHWYGVHHIKKFFIN